MQNKGFDRLKLQFEENPAGMILLASFALGACAKMLNALTAAQGRRAYAKQVKFRVRRGH